MIINDSIQLLIIAIIGSLFGSYLNVMIHRFPKNEDTLIKPSYCPQCNQSIKWFDLIPIISFLVLKRKCRQCKQNIPFAYPLIEIISICLFISCWTLTTSLLDFIKYTVFIYLLIPISLIDIKHKIIPNQITYSLLIIGTIFSMIENVFYAHFLWIFLI